MILESRYRKGRWVTLPILYRYIYTISVLYNTNLTDHQTWPWKLLVAALKTWPNPNPNTEQLWRGHYLSLDDNIEVIAQGEIECHCAELRNSNHLPLANSYITCRPAVRKKESQGCQLPLPEKKKRG
jgi:hypothetical protein